MIMVLYPVVTVLLGSFQGTGTGEESTFTLDAWRLAYSDPVMLSSIWNTLTVTLARQAIAIPVAVLLAWILARTDIPGANWLEFLFWLGYFLPTLPVTMGWILLMDPEYGLLNQWLRMLPFVDKSPFNIYSFWGIVWTHLTTSTIAVEVMLFTPAFRNMDASLEEASLVSGGSTLGTLARIVVPIMTPIVVVVLLLALVHSLQSFELELILGFPFRFYVFSTQIYLLLLQDPPLFAAATALSSIILALMLPLIILQRRALSRRTYTTVGGQFKGHKKNLGKWRAPIFLLVLGVALLITVVPICFLILGTFMKFFGFFNIPEPWTTEHWQRVFNDRVFLSSVWNTFILSAGTAVSAVFFFTIIGYIVARTRFVGRSALDLTSWFPSTLPGIILSLGLLSLFLGTPLLRPLYGTIFLLVIATVISSMTLGVQIIKSNFTQLGFELEEAARVSGGSWWDAFRHVLLPIITPTLLLVGAFAFISAARNISAVALIATSENRPLSLLQLDFMVEGLYESAGAVGVVVVLITVGVALIARVLGLRVGLPQ